MQKDMFIPNLVQIGRETFEKSSQEKKLKQTDRKIYYYLNFEKLHFCKNAILKGLTEI